MSKKKFQKYIKNIDYSISYENLIVNLYKNCKKNGIPPKLLSSFLFKDKLIVDEFIKFYDLSKLVDPPLFIKRFGPKLFEKKININNFISIYFREEEYRKRTAYSSSLIIEYFQRFYENELPKRKIIYHYGPTNSGKTHFALEELKKAKTGCYLAPLRLLAWEQHEKIPNSALITGEESIKPKNFTHSSSTIEMANLSKRYDVAVIDEIQMIGDKDRGWAWTNALINVNAEEVHLCGDPSAMHLVKTLVNLTNDTFEVREYKRLTDLKWSDKLITFESLESGDAIVVFSRKGVLQKKKELEALGHRVSVIYGMLSPEIRKEQARLFREGETDIIISTDAIGMGLNLPIKRIIFSTILKYYDGKNHELTTSEIKQIAGRAGRFKLHEEGAVHLLDQSYNEKWKYRYTFSDSDVQADNKYMSDKIKQGLSTESRMVNHAVVAPSLDLLDVINQRLEEEAQVKLELLEFLIIFKKIKMKGQFLKADISELVDKVNILYSTVGKEFSNEDIICFAKAPVMLNVDDHISLFTYLASNYFNERNSKPDYGLYSEHLDDLEIYLKKVEMYMWLSNQLSQYFNHDKNKLSKFRNSIILKINEILIKA